MKTTRNILARALAFAGLVALLLPGSTQAQQAATRRIPLQHDLAIPGRETVQARIEFDRGAAFGRHKHPGEEIIYVLEGSLQYEVAGQPPVTLQAGQVLFIPSGVVHAARNVGNGPAAELATYVVEKGKPLVTLVEPPTKR